jgi:hypothetical protein
MRGRDRPRTWPTAVLALLLSVKLGWLPAIGYGGFSYTVLPALVLAVEDDDHAPEQRGELHAEQVEERHRGVAQSMRRDDARARH